MLDLLTVNGRWEVFWRPTKTPRFMLREERMMESFTPLERATIEKSGMLSISSSKNLIRRTIGEIYLQPETILRIIRLSMTLCKMRELENFWIQMGLKFNIHKGWTKNSCRTCRTSRRSSRTSDQATWLKTSTATPKRCPCRQKFQTGPSVSLTVGPIETSRRKLLANRKA